jgi:excisionase family DNA binding protein
MAISDQEPVGANAKAKLFYTTGEVAEMFGVTRRTVTKWCEQGRIPSTVTPGGQRRIPVSALGGQVYQTRKEELKARLASKLAGHQIPTGEEIAEEIRSRRD